MRFRIATDETLSLDFFQTGAVADIRKILCRTHRQTLLHFIMKQADRQLIKLFLNNGQQSL